jgi:hypothetical protein
MTSRAMLRVVSKPSIRIWIRRFAERCGFRKGQWGFSIRKASNKVIIGRQLSPEHSADVESLSACARPRTFRVSTVAREFTSFNMRLRSLRMLSEQSKAPRLILPVLLDAPQDLPQLPPAVEHIQFFDDQYPAVYREEGLLYLLRRNSPELHDKYRDFLNTAT